MNIESSIEVARHMVLLILYVEKTDREFMEYLSKEGPEATEGATPRNPGLSLHM